MPHWQALKTAIETDRKQDVEQWILNHPNPPMDDFSMQNPILEAKEKYSLWFWAYNYDQRNHSVIENYFVKNNIQSAYWIEKEGYPQELYGIIDSLVERHDFEIAFALINNHPGLSKNIKLIKTVHGLINHCNHNKIIQYFASCLYIIFHCGGGTFKQIEPKIIKGFLQNYFKHFPSSKNCIFYSLSKKLDPEFKPDLLTPNPYGIEEILHDGQKQNEQRLDYLMQNHLIGVKEGLLLACQMPTGIDFFFGLLDINLKNKKINLKNNIKKPSLISTPSILFIYKKKLKEKLSTPLLWGEKKLQFLFKPEKNDFLQTSIINHNFQALEWLLKFGLDPDERNKNNMAPIHKLVKEKKFIDPLLYQDYTKDEYTKAVNLLGKHQANLLSSYNGTSILFNILKTESLLPHDKCTIIYEISQNCPWEDFKNSLKNFMKYLKKYELKFYNENLESIQQLEVIVERKKLTYLNQFFRPNIYKDTLKRLL